MQKVTREQVIKKFNEFIDLLKGFDEKDDKIAVLCFLGEDVKIDGTSKIKNIGALVGNAGIMDSLIVGNMQNDKNVRQAIQRANDHYRLISMGDGIIVLLDKLKKALEEKENLYEVEEPEKK